MPNTLFEILEIKRSNTLAAPTVLANGELAYSFVSNTLFIGNPNGGVINVISNTLASNLVTAANTVAVYNNGTLAMPNANVNFNNSSTIVVSSSANGATQVNVAFTFAQNANLAGVVGANASPTTNTVTRVYTGVTTFLTAATARVSNSTINVEANLSMTVNEVGTYMLDGFLAFFASANGVGGMKWDLGGGTATVAKALFSGSGYVNGAQSNQGAQTAITGASAFTAVGTNSTNPDWVAINGMLQITGPGTVVLRYGQNSTTANAINLMANSFLSLAKVG